MSKHIHIDLNEGLNKKQKEVLAHLNLDALAGRLRMNWSVSFSTLGTRHSKTLWALQRRGLVQITREDDRGGIRSFWSPVPMPTVEGLNEGSVRGAFKIGRSRSNPGYLNITFRDTADLDAAAKVFGDMAQADWLRDAAKEGTTDSLGAFVGKDSSDRWAGWVWWEDKQYGLDLLIRDTGDVVTVEVRGNRNTNAPSETHTYPRPKGRIDAKDFVIRATQVYLRAVLAGTTGQDKVFVKKERAAAKAGGPAQRKAIEKIRGWAKAAGREFVEEPVEGSPEVRVIVRPAPWPQGHGQSLVYVTIGATGGISTVSDRGRRVRGRAVWDSVRGELRGG